MEGIKRRLTVDEQFERQGLLLGRGTPGSCRA